MPATKRKASNDAEAAEYQPTAAAFSPRYVGPAEEELNERQIDIKNAILKSRPGTGLRGPFGPWLAVPDIAEPAQALGRACRYGTSLSYRESELVILLTGAKTRSHAEFDIHVGEALKAGISMKVIKSIPRDDHFSMETVEKELIPLLESEREKAICTFATELLVSYGVSDETYAMTKEALNYQESVLVEITSICGYYTFVSYTLNVFRIPSK